MNDHTEMLTAQLTVFYWFCRHLYRGWRKFKRAPGLALACSLFRDRGSASMVFASTLAKLPRHALQNLAGGFDLGKGNVTRMKRSPLYFLFAKNYRNL